MKPRQAARRAIFGKLHDVSPRATWLRGASLALGLASGCSLVTDLAGLTAGGDATPTDGGGGGADQSTTPDSGSGMPDAPLDVAANDAPNDGPPIDTGVDAGCKVTTTPFMPGTIAASGPGDADEIAWTATNGALVVGDSMQAASALTVAFDKSRPLIVRGFGLTVPAGATVLDVSFEITRSGADHDDEYVRIVSWSGVGMPSYGSGDRKSSTSWPVTAAPRTYVGSAGSWGKSLTPAFVSSGELGVALGVQYKGVGAADALVDGVRASVRYCE